MLGVSFSVKEAPVSIKIHTDQTTVAPGGVVELLVELENNTRRSLTLNGIGQGSPHLRFELEAGGKRETIAYPFGTYCGTGPGSFELGGSATRYVHTCFSVPSSLRSKSAPILTLQTLYKVISGVVRRGGIGDEVPPIAGEHIVRETAIHQEVLIEGEFASNLVVLQVVDFDPAILESRDAAKRLLQEVERELGPPGPTPPPGWGLELPAREDPEVIVSRTMRRVWTFVEENVHEPWGDDLAFAYAMIPTVKDHADAFRLFANRMIERFPGSTGDIQMSAYLRGTPVNLQGYTWK